MPWANGRGETREIARHPADGEFTWRLSMATVAEDAAFSRFPGVTRTLAVVDGGDLDLVVDGVSQRLRIGGPARTFSGEAAASAAPAAGTVTDLNLMVRGGLRGSIEPFAGGPVDPGQDTVFLVLLDTRETISVESPGEQPSGYLVRISA